ncbi:hypothetical protein ASPACDRAFT_43554 [Aspergillus aculeatus ATCC 16872]|uniref:Proline iminopeptidase aneH n=1 Tax=Aspergillus aculeatus (strain ATCC 16872 / CBS 172.66 / WB 5094) TaxID=690307 RepID=ANEH_ASPA1|nr:uncharacterized protein ASPACDRAFT_43554 [Aspergillus aculeatus ATCC 16872]A0A1L9WUM2.1 RecName: Full=Proline iminopeptidase aneH; Short=PIP; AltName: Full=Aculenes biosynthesis cluster protein HA [Aspergillus aculeatus ATCC 16872]OJJ99919.1 hypothetical protein ASPACDRAFT_43554 [Aspergillus aculeatus ATCC 16872]
MAVEQNIAPAKLIDRFSHDGPGKCRTSEWRFEVPLNHSKPDEGTVRLFARSIHCVLGVDDPELPWMLYLQGGPGLGCKTPLEYAWLPSILEKGYRVLFLDERGTGQSSPITAKTLAQQGDHKKQADLLKRFRADNIVRDCEAVRKHLYQDAPADQSKWSVMAASFGGFCAISYVSMFPNSLVEVFIGGGPCPMVNEPGQVIPRLFAVAARRNEVYYKKYPEDVGRVKRIIKYLKENKVALSKGTLTPERFQQLGVMLGLHGGIDYIHGVVQRTDNDLDMFKFLTAPTLDLIENSGMAHNVIYSLLQEPMYCQGKAGGWCADKCRKADPRFSLNERNAQIWFTGEAIFSDMFESYDELKDLKPVAELLARSSDWGQLYNEAQLARNEVPVYVATAVEDMYVSYDLGCHTASKVKNLQQVVNNTWYHDAVETKASEVMPALFALKEDRID